MLQLAKNALQTERVYLLLRGENRLNSTYKSKVFAPTLSPNIQCGSIVWNPPTLSFFHVKIFTKRLCRPFLQPKYYRKMISYHTKVNSPLFDERLKKNLGYFP